MGRWWRVMKRNELKRDKKFQKKLAREYGVSRPPESFYQAVEQAFDRLPEELPVRHRPMRTVFRTCVALAACLILLVGGAFGLNLANPLLMESIPGVGQIFQQINNSVDLNDRQDLVPTPSPDPNESQIQEEVVPAFDPITLESNTGEPFVLEVNNALCDGKYLYLKLNLDSWDPVWNSYSSLSTFSDDITNFATVLVNGEICQWVNPSRNENLFWKSTYTDDYSLFETEWYLELPSPVEERTDLTVELDLPMLYTFSEGAVDVYNSEVACMGTFSVTADPSHNMTWNTPMKDNGITLQSVEKGSFFFDVSLNIPYFGRFSDTMLSDASNSDLETSALIPLGIYPVLSTQDGIAVQETSQSLQNRSLLQFQSPEDESSFDATFSFTSPPENADILILTLYEYPTQPSDTPAYTDLPYPNNRVTAEFTIDLKNQLVYPSQNYQNQGIEKLDVQTSPYLDRTPTPKNGYICTLPASYYNYTEIALYSLDLSYRALALYCYEGDTVAKVIYSHPREEYNANVTEDSQVPFYTLYEDEDGRFQSTSLSMPTAYQRLYFQVNATKDEYDFTKFALVDAETGETLISDIQRTFCCQADEVLGTHMEEEQYGESQSTVSSIEETGENPVGSTPSPQP